mmetsp:Transcript_17458/g.44703  ORF Transcript_17458/g.44703 Transcript_17458/m.44703 type:complete len:223 (-) Transcript_17458:560-1228(-)
MIVIVSSRASSLFHILPESRITTGIEASMMTSDGTCRLVMPLCESTYASVGRAAALAAKSAITSSALGSVEIVSYTEPSPSLGLTPAAVSASACLAKASLKKTLTAWPNMMGSEIFIMVALRWSETIRLSSLAFTSDASKKERSWLIDMRAASMTSPASSFVSALSTLGAEPSAGCSSMRTVVAFAITVDCSEPKKSPSVMCDTCVLHAGSHLPSLCGRFWA